MHSGQLFLCRGDACPSTCSQMWAQGSCNAPCGLNWNSTCPSMSHCRRVLLLSLAGQAACQCTPDVETYMLPPKKGNTHIAPSSRPLRSCPLLPDDSMQPGAGSSRSSSNSHGSLAAQRGIRVKRQGAVAAGSVIGLFDGLQAFAHEMPGIAAKPPPGWQGSTVQWQLQFDAFSLDLSNFAVPVRVCREEAKVAKAANQPLALAVCALPHGNETALINDARPDPLSHPVLDPTGPRPDVMLVEVEVGGWIFPFAMATADIGPGQELLLDYGQEYWEGKRVELQAAAKRHWASWWTAAQAC